MNIEIPWQTFIRLPENRKLSLNEQQLQYYNYIQSLERERNNLRLQTMNTVTAGGGSRIKNYTFLLQENGFYILQENGFKIEIT
jgi:hypothetical protein